METLQRIHMRVKKELEACSAFWTENGIDPTHGGIYTCLDRTGRIYSTDKAVWMQGRSAWTFSKLCNVYGTDPVWQDAARKCLDFMESYCINREKGNRMYFTVTEDGRPIRQRRYCFSEGFYTMGNAEYYVLTGEKKHLERARAAYELIWQLDQALMDDPTGLGSKTILQTRQSRGLASPMIYLNLSMVMTQSDPEHASLYMGRAKRCIDVVLNHHFKPELRATLETVGMNGEFWPDISSGRVVNPGHDMECAWFLLEYASITKDDETRKRAIQMFDFAYEAGWDQEYGGLLYYTDVLGKPPEAYEHDMKLWWPHNELLIASLMIYRLTRDDRYLDIFIKAWEYAINAFSDPAYGEWYGYLRRDGKPTQPSAKGSTFKGPFHLPRMLILLDQMLGETAPYFGK